MTNRELDALVAEKIFGCKLGKKSQCLCYAKKHAQFDEEGFAYGVLSYSTEIAAAWHVVDNMRSKGYLFELAVDGTKEWVAGFDKTWPLSSDGFGDSASEAIVLAALKAVGVEVPHAG